MVAFTSSSNTRGCGPVGGSMYTFVLVRRFPKEEILNANRWFSMCQSLHS
uniref:Uncharacterized protein n=1 Tax=Triticum urartu TaxID=4572 RepID=A0A8R7TK40_TRIUA